MVGSWGCEVPEVEDLHPRTSSKLTKHHKTDTEDLEGALAPSMSLPIPCATPPMSLLYTRFSPWNLKNSFPGTYSHKSCHTMDLGTLSYVKASPLPAVTHQQQEPTNY